MTAAELEQLIAQAATTGTLTLSASQMPDAFAALFAYLPNGTLTVTSATATDDPLQLAGETSLNGGAILPCLVTFLAADDEIAGMTLRLQEPGWTLTYSGVTLDFTFMSSLGMDSLYFMLSELPNEAGGIVFAVNAGFGFRFGSPTPQTLAIYGEMRPPLTYGGTVDVPDIHLTGDFSKLNVGFQSLNELKQFAPNGTFAAVVAGVITSQTTMSLQMLDFIINAQQQSATAAVMTVHTDASWTVWQVPPNAITLGDLNLIFNTLLPANSTPTVNTSLEGGITFPNGDGTTFEVMARIDLASLDLYANLQGELELDSFLNVFLPQAEVPNLTVSEFGLQINLNTYQYAVHIAISESWFLTSTIELVQLALSVEGTGASIPDGVFLATFAVVGEDGSSATQLKLSAGVANGGRTWEFTGSTVGSNPIDAGGLVSGIARDFGITVPQAIAEIELSLVTLSVTVDMAANQYGFSFGFQGSTTICGVTASFAPQIAIQYDSTWSGTFGGTLVLGEGNTSLEFDVFFDSNMLASGTSMGCRFAPSVAGSGLAFTTLAMDLGFTNLPDIPPALDLTLMDAVFAYNFTSEELLLGAASVYGVALFVSAPVALPQPHTLYTLMLGVRQSFSLSNLPIVGQELAAIEDVSLGGMAVMISSEPVAQDTATAINTSIASTLSMLIDRVQYPTLPPKGLPGKLLLTAQLTFGGDALPLELALGAPDPTPAPAPAEASPGPVTMSSGQTVSTTTPDGTWYTVQKTFGPITIDRIGALFVESTSSLWFQLDATLRCGPVTLELTGLGVGCPLTTFAPSFCLQGLGVFYSEPPLTIGGALVSLAPPGANYIRFEGGIEIAAEAFSLNAFGYYGNEMGFPSMFLYGDIGYPIGGPPALFLTGLALGFGYNSSLRLPMVTEVDSFPLVAVLPTSLVPAPSLFGSSNPQPLDVLMKMTQPPAWVTDVKGSLWFAAGVTFTSFDLINSQALAIVTLGEQLAIALTGTTRGSIPPAPAPPFANVEFELLVTLLPIEGIFSMQAALSRHSYLLDPACVLTGGVAFFVWFGNNKHAGNFVLTAGGYSPSFTPPSYYPVAAGVGFHWTIDENISFTGTSYFAFTPAAIMLGGQFRAAYDDGSLVASFTANADIVVQWQPFWFDADIGVVISASYTGSVCGVHHTFSGQLSCDLELWGPKIGGTASLNLLFITLKISFGASKTSIPALTTWSQVVGMLPQASQSGGTASTLSITATEGLIPNGTAPPSDGSPSVNMWFVHGGDFKFRVSTPIPVTTTVFNGSSHSAGQSFPVCPLVASNSGWSNTLSSLSVAFQKIDETQQHFIDEFTFTLINSDGPASLWGAPPTNKHGVPTVPKSSQLMVKDLVTGVDVVMNAGSNGTLGGAVDVKQFLATDDLALSGALIPLSSSAAPSGATASSQPDSLQTISNPGTGIDSPTATASRNAIYGALQALGYAPAGARDSLSTLVSSIDYTFATNPLIQEPTQ